MPDHPDRRRKTRKSFNTPGDAHELTFSCHRRLALLASDRTRQWFLDAAREKWRLELWAYVIMPEHVHLLLLPPPEHDISAILKTIKQSVARRAMGWLRENAPHWLVNLQVQERSDAAPEYRFWKTGGGYDRNITEPRTAWASVDYLHHNPVKRGLVKSATDWPWSSAREYAGLDGVMLAMNARPPDLPLAGG